MKGTPRLRSARRGGALPAGILWLACSSLALGSLALGGLALGGCASTGEKGEERALLRRVRPTVAFFMLRDNRDMTLLDMRRPEEFEGPLGHLPRARNLPLEDLPQRLTELVALEKATFLIYCRADDCGETAVDLFLAAGFENVVVMDGGIEAWIDGGFGTVGGESGGIRARGMPRKPRRAGGESGPPPGGREGL